MPLLLVVVVFRLFYSATAGLRDAPLAFVWQTIVSARDDSVVQQNCSAEDLAAITAGSPYPCGFAEARPSQASLWLAYERDHRAYLTIGVGCTGGQHRSVYVAETARQLLSELGIEARCRHREAARWHVDREPKSDAFSYERKPLR